MKERQEKEIIKYLNIMNNTKDIAKQVKLEELKVQSVILTLARKGKINKDKAKQVLKDTQMIKFIDTPIQSGLSKPLNLKSDRYKRVSA